MSCEFTVCILIFTAFLNHIIILPKVRKPDNFELHSSLGLPIYQYLFGCESYLKSNPRDVLALCETNYDDSIDSGIFCYSYAWSCSLCEGTGVLLYVVYL